MVTLEDKDESDSVLPAQSTVTDLPRPTKTVMKKTRGDLVRLLDTMKNWAYLSNKQCDLEKASDELSNVVQWFGEALP